MTDWTDVLMELSSAGRDDLVAWIDARLKRYEADYDKVVAELNNPHDLGKVIPLTHQKTDHILKRDGFAITGFVLTHSDGRKCIVDMSAVRWFHEVREFQRMMHPDMMPDSNQDFDEIERLQRELAQWKNHHETEVRRARILKERPDLPIERVQAYEKWGEDLAELARLRHQVESSTNERKSE